MASESESTGRNGSQNSSYVPLSHPFVERLIGTIRRELLDHVLFWTAADLESKLSAFQTYYNRYRTHASLKGQTPIQSAESGGLNFKSYRLRQHCCGLYQTPQMITCPIF